MLTPAFLFMTMASSPPPPTNPPTSSRSPIHPSNPPKRVRSSELSRKYRHTTDDERILISDSSTPRSEPPSFQTSVRYSRFPDSWPETISQVISAVTHAVVEGHDRVRVDVKHPQLIARAPRAVARGAALERLALLVEIACTMIAEVMQLDPTDSQNFGMECKVCRAMLHFNCKEDADVGRAFIPNDLALVTEVHVLGAPLGRGTKADMAVVIAPSNQRGNPSHIENVESVHYSNWGHPKIIVMLNPELTALTRFSSFDDEPRQPGFLQDYLPSYYIDPVAFPTKTAVGAILRCFPRKWELYLSKLKGDMRFKLIAEQHKPPSAEKLRCEFAWRVAQDIGTAFSV